MSIAKLQAETTAQEMEIKAVYVNLWKSASKATRWENNHNLFLSRKM
jgi:hypothetical protein